MPFSTLKNYLDQQHVKYVLISHSPAYTAQEVAASVHISGRDMAKTVIVKIGDRLAMVVLPANRKVVIQDLRHHLDRMDVQFATEAEFQQRFPDCETGAMPPFGNLYDMEVLVAPSLAQEPDIAFNAGTHTEVVKMAYQDFERLVRPRVLPFTT